MMKLTLSDLKSQLTSLNDKAQTFLSDHPLFATMLASRQGRLAILAFVVLVVWFLIYLPLYQPGAKHLESVKKKLVVLNEKIAKTKAEIPDVAQEQKTLEQKNQEVESLKTQLKKIEERLPSRRELAPLLEQLTTSTKEGSLVILSIKPVEQKEQTKRGKKGGPAEPIFYQQDRFKLEMSTNFRDLVRYLSRLEKVSPYFSFPSLDIQLDAKREAGEPKAILEVATPLRERILSEAIGENVFQKDIPEFKFSEKNRDPFFSSRQSSRTKASLNEYHVSGVIWRGGKRVSWRPWVFLH